MSTIGHSSVHPLESPSFGGYNRAKQGAAPIVIPANSVAKPVAQKLRWYQFSLRSLLIFVTLVAFACSWFAVRLTRACSQERAVKRLLELKAEILYDHETDANGLPAIQSLRRLRKLSLVETSVADAGAAALQQALPECEIDREPPRVFEMRPPR